MAQQMILMAKSNYGRTAIYPVCEVSRAFAEACGTKTLSQSQLRCAERMGFALVLDAQITTAAMLLAA